MIQTAQKSIFLILLLSLLSGSVGATENSSAPAETVTPAAPEPIPIMKCLNPALHITVIASQGLLILCEKGEGTKTYRVSLGTGGIDKKIEGDRKTPSGIYTLGKPRSSDRFGIFIPVDYPTQAQKLAGFTGAGVGIHGPDRAYQFLGDLTVMVNWTAGCIAVGYDLEINEIKDWILEKHPQFIQITP